MIKYLFFLCFLPVSAFALTEEAKSFNESTYLHLMTGSLIVLSLFYLLSWICFGIDPPFKTIYARYDLPKKITPAQAGYIYNKGHFNKTIIVLSLLAMASRHFISIHKKHGGGFILHYGNKKPINKEEEIYLQCVEDHLVIDGNSSGTFESFKTALKKYCQKTLKGTYFESNSMFVYLGEVFFLLTLFVAGARVGVSEMPLYFLIIAASFVFLLINTLEYKYLYLILFLIVLMPSIAGAIYYFLKMPGVLNLLPFLLAGFVLTYVFKILVYRPKRQAVRILEHLEGLRLFMSKTHHIEREKLSEDYVEKLMPYALLMGMEKEWGQHFEQWVKKEELEGFGLCMNGDLLSFILSAFQSLNYADSITFLGKKW